MCLIIFWSTIILLSLDYQLCSRKSRGNTILIGPVRRGIHGTIGAGKSFGMEIRKEHIFTVIVLLSLSFLDTSRLQVILYDPPFLTPNNIEERSVMFVGVVYDISKVRAYGT